MQRKPKKQIILSRLAALERSVQTMAQAVDDLLRIVQRHMAVPLREQRIAALMWCAPRAEPERP